jgi:hypothetical protein
LRPCRTPTVGGQAVDNHAAAVDAVAVGATRADSDDVSRSGQRNSRAEPVTRSSALQVVSELNPLRRRAFVLIHAHDTWPAQKGSAVASDRKPKDVSAVLRKRHGVPDAFTGNYTLDGVAKL